MIMKSNGNGDYIVQKGTFALIMLIIALLSCVVTVAAYGATIKADVTFLKEEVLVIDELGDRIVGHDVAIITNQEKIIAMHDDIKEIKEGRTRK